MGKRGPKAKDKTPTNRSIPLAQGPTLKQCTLDMVELIGNINSAKPVFYTGTTYYTDFAVVNYIHNGTHYQANIDPDQTELFEELMGLLKMDACIDGTQKASFKEVMTALRCML